MIFSPPVNNKSLQYYYKHLVEALVNYFPLEGVALLPIDSDSFQPSISSDCSVFNVGVYLPESGLITTACLSSNFSWDMIIVPTLWLEYQLKIRGITNVITLLPGYEPFLPENSIERPHDGKFIVASSGTVSLQQGHDLILAAMNQFMALHDDCWFACNWYIPQHAIDVLCSSPFLKLEGCTPWDRVGFLKHNGIDSGRLLLYESGSAGETVLAASDVYISPARALLGDNELRSHFCSTGKPVITFEPLDSQPFLAPDGTTVWFEASVPDMLDHLESAYNTWRAGHSIVPPFEPHTWSMAADQMYAAITSRFSADKMQVSVFTWNKRGAVLSELGLYDAALANHHNALSINPLNPETYNCIGNLLDRQKRHQEALLYFEKAINLDKEFTAAHFNKATTLKEMERLHEAIDSYQRALQTDPFFVMGWLNLAIAFALNNQKEQAVDCFSKTAELAPDNTDALFLWGNQLLGQGDFEEAIVLYEKVLQLEPDHYLACNSMGIAFLSLMEAGKAYMYLSRALLIKPDMTSAMTNIGTACRDMERLDEAVLWYNRALELEPDDADNHWNLALALLHQGEYSQGWTEYEWRFQKTDKITINERKLPVWDGLSEIYGKTILLQAEQGYGDTIQFLRYALVVAKKGANVIVECQDTNIQSVIQCLPGRFDSISWADPQPDADFKFPLLSLPYVTKTTLTSIAYSEGYLFPPSEHIDSWRDLIEKQAESESLRVGFLWDGRKTFRNDRRSIPLQKLTPLFELEGITFISLQKGDQASQLNKLIGKYNILDISEHLTTFLDTAALVANLDLVVCVDTSVAHLSGSLGIPTWVALKIGPDWRWMDKRTDSPWYNSVKLYRQTIFDQWDDVVHRIYIDLAALKKNIKVPA